MTANTSLSNQITTTMAALTEHGFSVHHVASGEEAKNLAISLIPENAEVMTMTSVTLDTIGLSQAINEEGVRPSVRTKLNELNRETDSKLMNQLGAAPEVAVGSVQAVTQDGQILIISNSGSQIPAYAYGAQKVIFVVSAKKIVADINEALQRAEEVVLPLESERARKAYGVPGSQISKIFIYKKEIQPERVQIILVDEDLGY